LLADAPRTVEIIVERHGGASSVAKTVPEFIAYAKANPGKINVASGGQKVRSTSLGDAATALGLGPPSGPQLGAASLPHWTTSDAPGSGAAITHLSNVWAN
jgi:hypothetical protein